MKYLNKSIYAFALVGMAGLWSCSQEDVLQGGDVTASGHPVPVTLTVNRGDAQTRTVLSENETGGLNDVWVSGDVLHVYNKAGEEVGTLNLQSGEDTSVGVFSGLVNAEQGEQDLNLWYYGDVESNPNLSFTKYSQRNGLKVDLHKQNFADVKALSALDILSKGVTLNVNGEKSTVVKDETMETHLAMARFSLSGLPEGAKGQLNIYNVAGYGSNANSGEEYYNTLNTTTLDFARLGKAQTSTDKNDIVVENVEAGKDVFVAFIPSSYQLGFVFTNTADSKVYKGQFENKTDIEVGKYYTAFNETDGTYGAVEITMTTDKEEDVDHSKNPLLKWAETNLEGGKLYQWGRNHGFVDYKDAQGTLITRGQWGQYYYPYAVVTDAQVGMEMHAGTNIRISGGYYIQDSFLVPEDASDIKSIPEMYIMNAMIYSNNTKDYWIYGNGGNDWYSRAEACGYERTNPAPDGWRLPTVADFEEITPSKTFSGANSLSEYINSYSELKENEDVKYVMRWINNGSNVTIQALVVNEEFTSDQLSKVNWNDENVVERAFPYTGKIIGVTASKYISGGYDYAARPLPMGTYTLSSKSVGNYYETATIMTVTVKNDISESFGGYWVSDAKKAFKFVDNSKFKDIVSGQQSFMGIEDMDAHDAIAIRCVKAN